MKFDNKSKLLIAYIIDGGFDEIGRRFVRTKWVEAKGEVSLGSMTKPNKEIYAIKYFVPRGL